MDIMRTLEPRSTPRSLRIPELVAGLLATVALAGVYPVAGAIAEAMITTFRTDEAAPAAPILVSTRMAERYSLGLRPEDPAAAADTPHPIRFTGRSSSLPTREATP